MNLSRADLPGHLGRWVTVAHPDPRLAPAANWYGRLVALSDDPTVIVQSVGGGQGAFPQAFTITPAAPPPPGMLNPRRQAAYDAVFEHIRHLGPELPPDTVHRNAMIWRAVNAALDAAPLAVLADPDDPAEAARTSPKGDTPEDTLGDGVPRARDTAGRTAPAAGGHARLALPGDGLGQDLTSDVPARPHPGDTGDSGGDEEGDMGGDGVRFAYQATVRRGEIHAAITEAFDLLDQELHPRRPGLEEGSHDA